MEKYYDFEMIKTTHNGREYTIVLPEKGTENGHWVLKTEYFDAFPTVEVELVRRGYHLAHVKNITRWHKPEDTDARAELARYMHENYGVREKCVIVGMSCGGMQGIYFAAKYPQYVSCMYLDAPVVNLLSCPADLGKAAGGMFEEFEQHTGIGKTELLSYRKHPLDYIPALVGHNIPVILVAGDSDRTVPFDENGILLERAYEAAGCTIKTIIKPNADHHPHGLEDSTPILEFIEKYDG